jgi:hypothetical protein
MAQTKRKRRSKHRGTAAGAVSARGRTGRPLSADEKKKQSKLQARAQRLSTPPTWEGAFKRAGLAAALMFVFLLLTSKGNVAASVVFALFALGLYVPSGYYLERYLFNRRQRKQSAGR